MPLRSAHAKSGANGGPLGRVPKLPLEECVLAASSYKETFSATGRVEELVEGVHFEEAHVRNPVRGRGFARARRARLW